MKKKLIFICLITCVIFSGCAKEEPSNMKGIDNLIDGLSSTLSKEDFDIGTEEYTNTDNYIVEKTEDKIEISKISDKERLPVIKGFAFGPTNYAESSLLNEEEPVFFLDETFIPAYIRSEQNASEICSLRLYTVWNYSEEENKESYNGRFKTFLKKTANLFGENVFSLNSDILDISQLTEDKPIIYIYETDSMYIFVTIKDNDETVQNEQKTFVSCDIYYFSKDVPHTSGSTEQEIGRAHV